VADTYSVVAEKKDPLQGTTIEEAVTHLALKLVRGFPASGFATWWTSNFREEEPRSVL
jgi:hypothetical protein